VFHRLCLAVLLAPALVACGDPEDDDSPKAADPPAYYTDLAELTAAMDQENTAADQELNDSLPTTDQAEIGDLFSRATEESADRLEATLEEMAELTPPESADGAHEEFLAATRAELEVSRELAAQLAGLDQSALEALPPLAGQAAAEARTDVACAALQALADAAEADVRLCVGMFAEPTGG